MTVTPVALLEIELFATTIVKTTLLPTCGAELLTDFVLLKSAVGDTVGVFEDELLPGLKSGSVPEMVAIF